MTRYHIISAPLCSPLRFIINRTVIKQCRWYDGDAGVIRGDDPDVAPSTLRRHSPSIDTSLKLCKKPRRKNTEKERVVVLSHL
jgi:hypothetical protein